MIEKIASFIRVSLKEPENQSYYKVNNDGTLFDDSEVYSDDSLESDSFSGSSSKTKGNEDPELRAGDISNYTGDKVKLLVKDDSGNFVEWKPQMSGDGVLNNYTESEIAKALFDGTIKFTYTETGEELDLNTVRDILNGKIKPEDIKAPNKTDGTTETKPENPVTDDSDTASTGSTQIRTPEELEDALQDFADGIKPKDTALVVHYAEGADPAREINPYNLFFGLNDALKSDNPEIAGIAQVISDLYESMGADPKGTIQYSLASTAFGSLREDSKEAIITKAIFDAILGEEVLPETDYNDIKSLFAKKEEIITTDDLLALDKNGDGSIIEELKGLLTDPEFISKVEFELQRQENIDQNMKWINDIAGDDNKITEDEIKAKIGTNPIADLFKLDDGSFDLELFIVLGGRKDDDGKFSVNTEWFDMIFTNSRLNSIVDTDRDGNITKEEIAAYKNTEEYKTELNNYLKNN